MPIYSVHYFCNACSKVHPMGLDFTLNLEIDDWATIRDTYAGHPISRRLMAIEGNHLQCPETGRTVVQEDNDQLFLVRMTK